MPDFSPVLKSMAVFTQVYSGKKFVTNKPQMLLRLGVAKQVRELLNVSRNLLKRKKNPVTAIKILKML